MKRLPSLIVLLLVATGFCVQAQVKARPKTTDGPETTQRATTDDGKSVILNSNGTWKYATENSTAVIARKPGGRPNSELSIETGLVYQSGDVKPLARTEFNLLDDSLANILRNAGLKPPSASGESGDSDEDYVTGFAFASKYSSLATYSEYYPKAVAALKPHIVKTVTTDFGGKATFEPVPAATYYIMGIGTTAKGFAIWNLKTELKPGKNPIVLDQNNAATAF